ncbi:uncharacterized protein LOC131690437 [Topomyia yanbarensis]|uniref:uncharacterized protein LOC131690437 n=1 Tax=Topomyia yanbarensis TaxID=2498891 RepID=UPI00273AF613|nr:uncharacterized protein LOC131690437 [Topomyia yanbarensis]
MLMVVEDCMRSKRFRDLLQDPFELAHMRVSGPIYQEDTDSFLDIWHPVQMFCTKCCTPFDDPLAMDAHEKCRFKCLYCKRTYAFRESYLVHTCPKRDRYRNAQKRKYVDVILGPPAKRAKVVEDPQLAAVVEREKPKEKPALQAIAVPSPEKNSVQVIALPDLLPAPAVVPHIEGEANLDAELSNLLERWYGQNEDIDELSHTNLGAIQITNDNGVITNSEFYGRVIDTAFTTTSEVQRPAISVKPMSQLIDATAEPISSIMQLPSTSDPPVEIIEIDDDDEVEAGQAGALTASCPQLNKPDQPALSESDILNIVKHFRGIDENESYLIKAKINGAQKLICISKRKGEGNGQPTNTATIVNNNSALQSVSRRPEQRPVVIAPTIRPQPTMVSPSAPAAPSAPAKSTLVVKNVADINGMQNPVQTPNTTVPQLKIAHVQSLVQQPQATQSNQQLHRMSNGKQVAVKQSVNRQTASGGNPKIVTIPKRVPASIRSAASNQQSTSSGGDPRRIIVGSNSLKLLNTAKPLKPNTPKSLMTGAIASSSSTTTSTQQRIIVQRKQVQTIIQSSVSRTSSGAVSSVQSVADSDAAATNSLLRSQLLQRPARIYPGSAGAASHGDGMTVAQPKIVATGGKVMAVSPSGRHFQLNSTTITRLN